MRKFTLTCPDGHKASFLAKDLLEARLFVLQALQEDENHEVSDEQLTEAL